MAKLNIKKGDNVLVITGKDVGKTGEVLDCYPESNKVIVKGINTIVKHNKPRSAQDKGGIVKKEGKIDVSDVMVVCPACNKATRIKIGKNEKGEKVRICKKCGAVLEVKKVSTKKVAKSEKVEAEKPAKKSTAKTTEKKVTAKESKNLEPKNAAKSVKVAPVKKASNTAKKIGGK